MKHSPEVDSVIYTSKEIIHHIIWQGISQTQQGTEITMANQNLSKQCPRGQVPWPCNKSFFNEELKITNYFNTPKHLKDITYYTLIAVYCDFQCSFTQRTCAKCENPVPLLIIFITAN